ncbi:hypothetical protein EVA_05973 [gut metagenome]|uniref:Uncharacterized protein n=1 Tax=gut metagenome TaxID=749906 RepID=J9GF04_9ZZZZ
MISRSFSIDKDFCFLKYTIKLQKYKTFQIVPVHFKVTTIPTIAGIKIL